MIDPRRFPEPWKQHEEITDKLSDDALLYLLERIKPENVEFFEKDLLGILEKRKSERPIKYAENRKNGLYCYIALIITAVLCADFRVSMLITAFGPYLILLASFVCWPFSLIHAYIKKKDFFPDDVPNSDSTTHWIKIYLLLSWMLGPATLLLHYVS